MSLLASRVFSKHVATDALQLTTQCCAPLMSGTNDLRVRASLNPVEADKRQTNTAHRQVSAHNTHTSIMGVTQLRNLNRP